MSLLDRLRGQPDWRHEDPSVRASAVDELEDDAQDLFEAIASEDADPTVRLAAVIRLSDPSAIGRIARSDADPQVRDEAAAMLRATAVGAAEPDAGESALAGLSDARDLGEVARAARVESVSRSALERLDEQKAIGAVARRSVHRAVREAALARLDARDELAAAAVKTDHREIALAAFDRLAPFGSTDRDLLRTIAVRARTKPVSRRAKTALAELDDRPVPLTADERRSRRQALCDQVELLTGVEQPDAVRTGLDRAERDWRALVADAPTNGDAPGNDGAPASGVVPEAPADALPTGVAPEAPVATPASDAPRNAEASITAVPPDSDAPGTADAPTADPPPDGDAPGTADTPTAGVAPEPAVAPTDDAPPAADAPVAAPVAGDASDEALDERWRAAVGAATDHLARLDEARSAADRRSQARRDALASRTALCDRLVALAADEGRDADALAAEIGTVRAEWTTLPELPPGDADPAADAPAATDPAAADDPATDGGATNGGATDGDAAPIERRFAELLAAAEQRADRRRTDVARLTALVERLEALSASSDPDALTKAWSEPHREWKAAAQASTPAEAAGLVPRAEAAERKRNERLTAAREARQRREQANLAKQQARCDEIERVLADEKTELKDAEHCLRLARSLLGDLGRLPTRKDRETLVNRLRAAQTGLTGRVRELRGLAEWKQWANVGVQASLCQRLEALAERDEKDDEAFAREFRQIMGAWRQAADVVARDEGNEVWRRFKAAHDAVHPRFEAYQSAQDAVRGDNLAKKTALCEEAERLAESTEWVKTAQRITELQAEWKQIGSAARKDEREAWNRFRAACGRFFRRRREDLSERKQVWAENARLKEALCGKAEALAGEDDLETAKAAVRQLQTEWKTVGPVRRSRSEALWNRFRAACDQVYERAREAVDAPYADLIRARAEVCERLEALAAGSAAPAGDAPQADSAGSAGNAPQTDSAAAAGDAPPPTDSAGPAGEPPPTDSAPPAAGSPAPAGDVPPPTDSSAPAGEPPQDLAETVEAARREWRAMEAIPRPQERSLTARFDTALNRLVDRFPGAFADTDLDPLRKLPTLERLCERVEALTREERAGAAPAAAQSPSELLASRLREALASNTMGGRVDADAKRREDAETVRRLQADRRALGNVPGETARQLSERFRAACARFFELNPPPPSAPSGSGRPRRGGRPPRDGGSSRRRRG